MSQARWKITLKVFRKKEGKLAHYDRFPLEVDPDEYVLDAIERVWAFHDRSLTFRHACHHSTCGACGMRVNGVEKLTCITLIRSVTKDGATLTIDPLRNFPLISDLVVDSSPFYSLMDKVHYPAVTPETNAPVDDTIYPAGRRAEPGMERLNDCIECGLCISACPIATTTETYLGPAVLAGIQFNGIKNHPDLTSMADSQDGVWRCHSVYECTQVCPSFVDPAWRIMDLRRQVIAQRIHQIFFPSKG